MYLGLCDVLTLVMGPLAVLVLLPVLHVVPLVTLEPERGVPAEEAPFRRGVPLDTNPAIDWETPSAKMNCSRSSMFVRPLARENVKDYINYMTNASVYS